jgi:hypothetical protein
MFPTNRREGLMSALTNKQRKSLANKAAAGAAERKEMNKKIKEQGGLLNSEDDTMGGIGVPQLPIGNMRNAFGLGPLQGVAGTAYPPRSQNRGFSMERPNNAAEVAALTGQHVNTVAKAMNQNSNENNASLSAAAAAAGAGGGAAPAATDTPWRVATGVNPLPRQILYHYALLIAVTNHNIAEINKIAAAEQKRRTTDQETRDLLHQSSTFILIPEYKNYPDLLNAIKNVYRVAGKKIGLTQAALNSI